MGHFRLPPPRFWGTPVDAGVGSASLVSCASTGVATAMGCCEDVGLGAEDVVGCPWVVGAWAFATDPAVRGGLSHETSSFWVVASVVGS
jgi:hypothetical protein